MSVKLPAWKSLGELGGDERVREQSLHEFMPGASEPPVLPDEVEGGGVSRRRFLGLVGMTAALGGAVACSRPKGVAVVPYTRKPPEVIPGVADFYATCYQEGPEAHSLLVKSREGRPVFIEGNDEHPGFKGKTSSRAQAQIMALYSPERVKAPELEGRPAGWPDVQGRLNKALADAKALGRGVLLLTGASSSPSRRAVIAELRKVLPTLRHVAWEPLANHSARTAALSAFGEALTAAPRYDKAKVILALEADFLGAMDGSVPAIAAFAAGRRVRGKQGDMSRLYVAEGGMTLTGANADQRLRLKPTAAGAFAMALARELNARHGVALPSGVDGSALSSFDLGAISKEQGLASAVVSALVADLAKAGREALVVAGPALPAEAHVAAHLLNVMLGAEGSTLDATEALPMEELAAPGDMEKLAAEMASGAYGAALLWDVNPAFALPAGSAWMGAFSKVPFRAILASLPDETTGAASAVLPLSHWLESWGDVDFSGTLSGLQQPLIEPLYDTRQGEEVLMAAATSLGASLPKSYHDLVRERWRREVYPAGSPVGFDAFWNAALHDGVLKRQAQPRPARLLRGAAVSEAAKALAAGRPGGYDLILHADGKVYDGRHAHIGWLQELPDPVSKMVWGNALSLSPAEASKLGVADGDLVKVEAGAASAVLPALVQPGQAEGVLEAALGYGRRAGTVGREVGTDLFPLLSAGFLASGVKLSKAVGKGQLVRTQDHHSLHGRDIARSLTLEEHRREGGEKREDEVTLYDRVKFPGHKWGMVIDMAACVGCSGCVVACQSENNVPVVGPEQVERGREMHWIRIDRYYEGPPEAPRTLHQPMLCQHCDDAPCENVCPVAATTHSPDGLNQMAYNRCVGTRYCANNCPYKVRRFNFLDYTSSPQSPTELAYNPEVTVRPRGVMEKCSFCVQRISDVRQRANVEGRAVRDGEIRPACAAACPAEAIVFGDVNDPTSEVAKLSADGRGYGVLKELGVKPSITYLAHLTNPAVTGDHHES